jgi:phenylacetate-coenzyme A ligase PaaK-like adenylate-forming protein
VEVLDEEGRPCAPGETGRVVATSLNNFAMPLIRYETGDTAEVGAPCPCGRGLPVLTRIMGRDLPA